MSAKRDRTSAEREGARSASEGPTTPDQKTKPTTLRKSIVSPADGQANWTGLSVNKGTARSLSDYNYHNSFIFFLIVIAKFSYHREV